MFPTPDHHSCSVSKTCDNMYPKSIYVIRHHPGIDYLLPSYCSMVEWNTCPWILTIISTYSPLHSQFLPLTTRQWEIWWHRLSFQWVYSHQQHHSEPSQQCSKNLCKQFYLSTTAFSLWLSTNISKHQNCYANALTWVLFEIGICESLLRLASSESPCHSWERLFEAQKTLGIVALNWLSLWQNFA